MIIAGLIMLILGFVFGVALLWQIGIAVAVIGLVLLLVSTSRGTRRYW